jgi:TRAP-type C4-dicarboxylate transport system substrate-binding protein
LQEVAKYAAPLHAFSAIPFALAVNKAAWDKLPADLQAVVSEAGKWLTEKSLAEARTSTLEADIGKQLIAGGFSIHDEGFPAADRRAYYEAASTMWAEKVKALGPEAEAYRNAVVQKLNSVR